MNDTNTIIIFLGCIMAIILFGKIFILPMKMIIKLIINSVLGGLIIYVINWVGVMWNLHIGLNVFTAIFVRNTWNPRSNTAYDIQIICIIILFFVLKKNNINSIIYKTKYK